MSPSERERTKFHFRFSSYLTSNAANGKSIRHRLNCDFVALLMWSELISHNAHIINSIWLESNWTRSHRSHSTMHRIEYGILILTPILYSLLLVSFVYSFIVRHPYDCHRTLTIATDDDKCVWSVMVKIKRTRLIIFWYKIIMKRKKTVFNRKLLCAADTTLDLCMRIHRWVYHIKFSSPLSFLNVYFVRRFVFSVTMIRQISNVSDHKLNCVSIRNESHSIYIKRAITKSKATFICADYSVS